jgi:hypothetical protein
MMNVPTMFRTGINALTDNAPAILTAFGAAGVVGTAVLSVKATFQAAERIQLAEIDLNIEAETDSDLVFLTKTEKFKLIWPLYIGAVSSGVLSCGAIVMSHRISSKRAAVLAAAYALNEGKLEEYQDKIKEKFGIKKEKDARDELAQEKVNAVSNEGFVFADPTAGKVWIMEAYTGRPFLSTVETVKQAANMVNAEMNAETNRKKKFSTMDDFYKKLGLEPTSMSHAFGWTAEDYLSLDWSTTASPDGNIAVHVFEYVGGPVMNPSRAAENDASFR